MHTFTHSLSHMSLLTNSLTHWHTCICLHGHSHVFTYAHALACSQTKILTYSVTHRYTLTLSCYLHHHSRVDVSLHVYSPTNTLNPSHTWTCSPTDEHSQRRACVYIYSLLTSNKVTLTQRQTHVYSQTRADAHQQSHVWTWSHMQSYSICKYTYMLSPQSACSTYEHAPTFPTEIIIPHITHSHVYLHTNSLT